MHDKSVVHPAGVLSLKFIDQPRAEGRAPRTHETNRTAPILRPSRGPARRDASYRRRVVKAAASAVHQFKTGMGPTLEDDGCGRRKWPDTALDHVRRVNALHIAVRPDGWNARLSIHTRNSDGG